MEIINLCLAMNIRPRSVNPDIKILRVIHLPLPIVVYTSESAPHIMALKRNETNISNRLSLNGQTQNAFAKSM